MFDYLPPWARNSAYLGLSAFGISIVLLGVAGAILVFFPGLARWNDGVIPLGLAIAGATLFCVMLLSAAAIAVKAQRRGVWW